MLLTWTGHVKVQDLKSTENWQKLTECLALVQPCSTIGLRQNWQSLFSDPSMGAYRLVCVKTSNFSPMLTAMRLTNSLTPVAVIRVINKLRFWTVVWLLVPHHQNVHSSPDSTFSIPMSVYLLFLHFLNPQSQPQTKDTQVVALYSFCDLEKYWFSFICLLVVLYNILLKNTLQVSVQSIWW